MKFGRLNTFLFIFGLLLFLSLPLGAQAERKRNSHARPSVPASLSFVHWSDLHLGEEHTHRQDWEKLLEQGLNDSRSSLYVFSGDFVDNKNADEAKFQERIDDFCTNYMSRIVKTGKPVVITYGNNDFYKNYNTELDNMRPIMNAMKETMGDGYYLDELGNGVYPQRINGVTFISVNSLIFSRINKCRKAVLDKQRQDTLDWTEAALSAVPARSTAVIVCHVPPCTDAYDNQVHWDAESLKRFHQILANAECSTVIYSGHTHTNECHNFYINETKSVPLFIVGAVSEKYGYHANFRVTTFDFDPASGAPADTSWTLYYADQDLGNKSFVISEPCVPSTWEELEEALQDDDFYFDYMQDFYTHCSGWEQKVKNPKFRQEVYDNFEIKTGWADDHRIPEPENHDFDEYEEEEEFEAA